LETSMDGENWRQADKKTAAFPGESEPMTFAVSQSDKARFMRLRPTDDLSIVSIFGALDEVLPVDGMDQSRDGKTLTRCWTDSVRIAIPDQVEVISERCFCGYMRLAEVVFEADSRLSRIDKEAFVGSSLPSIKILNRVRVISERCFRGCRRLKCVGFAYDSQPNEIEKEAFRGSSLEGINIPLACKVADDSFFDCSCQKRTPRRATLE